VIAKGDFTGANNFLKMYFVYIIENEISKWYIGFTSNIKKRIVDHNS